MEYVETSGSFGPDYAYLRDSGVDIWALVMYYQRVANEDVAIVACDYAIPIEAVEAALAFYREHRAVIDARIKSNVIYAA